MTKPTTIEKTLIPHTALRTQTLTGLYFEYTALYGRKADDHAEVQVQNLAMFAVGGFLFTKRGVGTIRIADKSVLTTDSVQSNFRSSSSDYSNKITPDHAFLTVMHGWEFATRRKPLSAIKTRSKAGNPETLVTAAHAVISEPFMFPIGKTDAEAVAREDGNTVRRIARVAETVWLGLSNAPTWEDGTAAHRIPGSPKSTHELESGSLMSNLAVAVSSAKANDLPEWKPITGTPADALPEFLRETAMNRRSWEG